MSAWVDGPVPGTGRQTRAAAGEVVSPSGGSDGADAFADKLENDKEAGSRIDPARGLVPLRVWAREWLERRVIGESTRRNYEGFIHNHLVPRLGRRMLAGLTRRDFEEFARDVHASGAGLAVSTVNDRMVMVAAILEAAVVDKRIPDNPARGVRIARAAPCAVDEDEIPTLNEVDLIAEHIAPRPKYHATQPAGLLRLDGARQRHPDP